ncbi:gamma-tubulin complex component 2 [Phtheirospermum japonicum]|uniref:Gamma-tubulin complex component 2 n=1 Tax=Phtheirospermum japonicum TaxID=374723 RepID=A0A830D248_9LAMI|nr:gamma-tubulin complex component 2 [Phtheirospermum japonicum]
MDSAVPSPCTPKWNVYSPFLTGRFHQETKSASGVAESKGFSLESFGPGVENPIGCLPCGNTGNILNKTCPFNHDITHSYNHPMSAFNIAMKLKLAFYASRIIW